MSRGTWDDFTDKFGFNDGESLEDRDFKARDLLVKLINKQMPPTARAIPFDRAGCHNACLVLLVEVPAGTTQKKAEKLFDTSNLVEASLPEGLEIEDLVREAYDKIDDKCRST